MIYSIIYLGICLFWFSFELILLIKRRSAKLSSAFPQDKTTLKLLWITIILSMLAGIFWSFSTVGKNYFGRIYFYWMGIFLFFLGIVTRWTAIHQLGKFFTVDVCVQKGQRIISSGLYRFIRHPAYLGELILVFGLGLALNNWISLLLIFLPVFSAFLYRIKLEEKLLETTFGQEYEEYQKKTKKLIPKVY